VATHAYSHGDRCSMLARLTEDEEKLVEKKCSIWVVVAHLRVNLRVVERRRRSMMDSDGGSSLCVGKTGDA
jgi:hypothetical protein